MNEMYKNVDVEEMYLFIKQARRQLASVKENVIVAIAMIFGAIALITLSVVAFGFSPEGDYFAFLGISVGVGALCIGIVICFQVKVEFNYARRNLVRALKVFAQI